MYDQNLGAALGYGDISSTNNARQRGYGGWRRRERDLNQSPQPEGALYPESQENNQPLQQAITKQKPPSAMGMKPLGSMPDTAGVAAPSSMQGAMSGLYNRPHQGYGGPRPISPLQQTGYQQRFFNPQGTDNQAQAPQAPPAQETNLANALTKQGRGFTNAGGAWGNFNYTPGQVGQFANQLEGFNLDKLNPEHADNNTMKYIFATAASNVDVNDPEAGAKVVQELQRMGINATLEGQYGDRIKFPTGESIDVIRNSGRVGGDPNATLGWQWIDAAYDGQPASQTGQGQMDPMMSALLGGNFDPAMLEGMDPNNPLLAQILAMLSQQNAVT